MRLWSSVIGAIVLSAGVCTSSYGFDWLDRLVGIDLDNSEAPQTYSQPVSTYRPYSAWYAPYSAGYPAPVINGPSCGAMWGCASQPSYRTVYLAVPVTSYQPITTFDACGNQLTAMRPVVTYRMQVQVVPCAVNPQIHAPQ